jgi:hypothetical protein
MCLRCRIDRDKQWTTRRGDIQNRLILKALPQYSNHSRRHAFADKFLTCLRFLTGGFSFSLTQLLPLPLCRAAPIMVLMYL